ncbi:MAG: ABC transporter permease subunit [Oscillospiraceae bacterium]|jgi:putative aldouronate transport system permease protein|nr:ABC transporter permease subunit [Oscillospiraceae bacterium]
MLLPPAAFLVLFCYIPLAGNIAAFKDYNIFEGLWASRWAGSRHFAEAFRSVEFRYALRNTLLLNAGDLLFSFPAPILLAVTLMELRGSKLRKATQFILFLPHFFSMVIVAGIVYQVFSGTGLINAALAALGIPRVGFLGTPALWMVVYWVSGVWKGTGYGMIIYLAALTAVDPALGEAAAIDGAGRWKRVTRITLPVIRPTIVTLLILNLGGVLSIGFDRPYLLGNVLVSDVSNVISTHVYAVGMQAGRFDFATAIGLFQSAVGIVMVACANLFARRLGEEGIV